MHDNSVVGSGVICCGTAILAVTVHGRDARAWSFYIFKRRRPE